MTDSENILSDEALAPLRKQSTQALIAVFDKADELQRQIMDVLYDRLYEGDNDGDLKAFCDAHDTDPPYLA